MTVSRLLRKPSIFVALLALTSAACSSHTGSSASGTQAAPTIAPTPTASRSTDAATNTTTTAPSVDAQPSFPIRAAFYYPWFPEAWTQQGRSPYSHYTPSLGFYSSDTAVLANHVATMRTAGLDAGIASWWGPSTPTDQRIPLLLTAATGTPFRWTLYYEREGYSDPTVVQIQSDLAYIDTHYGHARTFLRIGGRPALFVYASAGDRCAMAQRWIQANVQHTFYIVLKVFPHYKTCPSQPDAWHQYDPAVAVARQPGSFTISPGFWKVGTPTPRLVRDPSRWTTDVRAMAASGAPWQLVTTFNEWGEGTAIESSSDWNTTYLDILAKHPTHKT